MWKNRRGKSKIQVKCPHAVLKFDPATRKRFHADVLVGALRNPAGFLGMNKKKKKEEKVRPTREIILCWTG